MIRELFSKHGVIEDVRFPKSGGCCFVQFETLEECEAALQENGATLDGAEIKVDKSSNRSKPTNAFSIFVGNLSYNTTEESLRNAFGECGNVIRVSIPQNEMGSKGFAFVDFDTEEAQKKAIEYNETDLDGRTIRVDVGSKGGRGGGGGFRGSDRGGGRGGGRGFGGDRGGGRGRGFGGGRGKW